MARMAKPRRNEPNPFRAQHGDLVEIGPGLRQERAGTPLDFLKRHKGADGRSFLTAAECEAAERLTNDFEQAELRPRLTSDLSIISQRTPRGPASTPANVVAIDAKRRCLSALEAVGPGLGDLLFEIVCMARGLNEAEHGFGWPARSGKAILKLALGRLAAHYGLQSGTRRAGRIEAWAAEVA